MVLPEPAMPRSRKTPLGTSSESPCNCRFRSATYSSNRRTNVPLCSAGGVSVTRSPPSHACHARQRSSSHAALAAAPGRDGLLSKLFPRRDAGVAVPGLYLWGGVGRGKTFLIDLFFDQLEIARKRRHERVRKKVTGTAERPRLNVYRSLDNIYAQVIDDSTGNTLVSASTVDKELRGQLEPLKKAEQAKAVGRAIAERDQAKGIKEVVFDRGGYPYHGRVKALADGSREGGLVF